VRGDFDIEATFELLNVDKPQRLASGMTIYLHQPKAPRSDGFWVGKMNDANVGLCFSTGQRVTLDGKRSTKSLKLTPTPAATGVARIRFVRKHETLRSLAAEGEAGEYQVLDTYKVTTADLAIVRFAIDPAEVDSLRIDTRLIAVSIAAEELVGYEPN
jgi:hypothetical protein